MGKKTLGWPTGYYFHESDIQNIEERGAPLLGRTESLLENLGRGKVGGGKIKKMGRMMEGKKNVEKYANASAKGVSCPGKKN